MAIRVACKCGEQFKFKDEDRGKTARCTGCKQPLVIQGRRIAGHDLFISHYSRKRDNRVATTLCAAL